MCKWIKLIRLCAALALCMAMLLSIAASAEDYSAAFEDFMDEASEDYPCNSVLVGGKLALSTLARGDDAPTSLTICIIDSKMLLQYADDCGIQTVQVIDALQQSVQNPCFPPVELEGSYDAVFLSASLNAPFQMKILEGTRIKALIMDCAATVICEGSIDAYYGVEGSELLCKHEHVRASSIEALMELLGLEIESEEIDIGSIDYTLVLGDGKKPETNEPKTKLPDCGAKGHSLTDGREHALCDTCGTFLCNDEDHGVCALCSSRVCDGKLHDQFGCGAHCSAMELDGDVSHDQCPTCSGFFCDDTDHSPCALCSSRVCDGETHDALDCGVHCSAMGAADGKEHKICEHCSKCISTGSHELRACKQDWHYECVEDGLTHERCACGDYLCEGEAGEHAPCAVCNEPLCMGDHAPASCNQPGHFNCKGAHVICPHCEEYACLSPNKVHGYLHISDLPKEEEGGSEDQIPHGPCPQGDPSDPLHNELIVTPDGNLCPYCKKDLNLGVHGIASCDTAGHYICDGSRHYICKACKNYLCNGAPHGLCAICNKQLCVGDHSSCNDAASPDLDAETSGDTTQESPIVEAETEPQI